MHSPIFGNFLLWHMTHYKYIKMINNIVGFS